MMQWFKFIIVDDNKYFSKDGFFTDNPSSAYIFDNFKDARDKVKKIGGVVKPIIEERNKI